MRRDQRSLARICAILVVIAAKSSSVAMSEGASTSVSLAIRPYPTQYAKPWTLKDGHKVMIRPIRAEDVRALRTLAAGRVWNGVEMRIKEP